MKSKNVKKIKSLIFVILNILIFLFIIGTWNGPFRWRFFRNYKISEKSQDFFWMNPDYMSSLKIWEWLSNKDLKDGGVDYYPFVLGAVYIERLGSVYHGRRTFSGATWQNCSRYLGRLRDYINRDWEIQEYSNFISILNIRYIMPWRFDDRHMELTKEISVSGLFEKVYDNEGFLIYENKRTLPYIRTVDKGVLLKGYDTEGLIHTVMLDKNFNPEKLLFISEEVFSECNPKHISLEGFFITDRNRIADFLHNTKLQGVSKNIKIQGVKMKRILGVVGVDIEVNRPGFIVLSEPYFRGWKAYLDGKGIPVIPAYDCLVGVFIPDLGKHRLLIYYGHTLLQKVGFAISSCAFIICIFYVSNFPWFRKRIKGKK